MSNPSTGGSERSRRWRVGLHQRPRAAPDRSGVLAHGVELRVDAWGDGGRPDQGVDGVEGAAAALTRDVARDRLGDDGGDGAVGLGGELSCLGGDVVGDGDGEGA